MTNATLLPIARPPVVKPLRRHWRWIALVLSAAGGLWGGVRALSLDSPQPPAEPRPLPARVSALGRLAPEGEVVAVAPPTPTGTLAGARVEQLLVAVGDEVKVGQVVAILDTRRSRDATVFEGNAKVEVAKAKLAQVKAGPNPRTSKHRKL